MMKKILIILFISYLHLSYSQESCGTHISNEEMQVFYNRDLSHLETAAKAGTTIYLPIVYHITRENDGTGDYTKEETIRLHCELNNKFSDSKIQFYILDIIFHDNSYYYHMDGSGAGTSMMVNENNINACNVFIVKEAKSSGTPVCGYAYFASSTWGVPNRGGIVIDIECSGDDSNTFPHEMGHYLNLPHTFYGWEGHDYIDNPISSFQWERVDGSNCLSTGDGFCDTSPDYISDRWECNTPKTFNDAIGTLFTVDEKNFMSYSLDGCKYEFKNEQILEMEAAPASYRPYLLTLPVPNVEPLEKTTLKFPPNGGDVAAELIQFEWDEVEGADYYLIQISYTNFINPFIEKIVYTNSFSSSSLSINQNYVWRVKGFNYGSTCNEYDEGEFSTNSIFLSTSTSKDALCSGENSGEAVALTDTSDIVSYKWYLYESTIDAYVLVSTTTSNTNSSLNKGSYYVELIDNNDNKSLSYFTIGEPEELAVNLTVDSVNGSINSTVIGGIPPYSYQWSPGDQSAINNDPIEGVNTLYVNDANDCFIVENIIYEKKDDINSINTIISTSSLVLYPNPIKGNQVFINFESKMNSSLEINLLSIEGKKLNKYRTEVHIGKNKIPYQLNDLTKGVYLIELNFNNKKIVKKIIL